MRLGNEYCVRVAKFRADRRPCRIGSLGGLACRAERILDHLSEKRYDCIVIGGGIRLTTKHVPEFEQVITAIRHAAPETPIAFNSSFYSSSEAAARWL
jgi:uncharacterized Fe-S radical SAM superfamily protein PflX